MLKSIMAILAGVVAGSFVIWIFEWLGHEIIPPPEGMDLMDAESVKKHIKELPPIAFVLVLVAYAGGAYVGGLVSAAIINKSKIAHALITGGVLLVFALVNLVIIPHPVWFTVVSLLLYLPFAYLGGKTMAK